MEIQIEIGKAQAISLDETAQKYNSHVRRDGSPYTNGAINILINASFYIKRVFFMEVGR